MSALSGQDRSPLPAECRRLTADHFAVPRFPLIDSGPPPAQITAMPSTLTPLKYPDLRNYLAGTLVDADLPQIDLNDPGTGEVIARVPLSTPDQVDAAVEAAAAAFPAWSALPIKERVQVFFRYKALLERHLDGLAALITEENGKTLAESRAEVLKAAELTEFACSLPQIATGEVLEVSRGIECRVERFPVGIVAAVTPFNFPSMVPHWSIPNALALGNCMILKPSELVPLSAMRIAELLAEAGLPAGVLNIVHGGREVVEAICDHPGIAAISFVGSTAAAKAVYRRATANLKRCLALGGAKNHIIVMPDADREATATNIVASMAGSAGQRCMAASVMLAVAETEPIIARMTEVARAIVPGTDIGPVISAEARARIISHIDAAEAAGARVIVDGRNATVPGREGGYFLGPTIIDGVTPDMAIAREEVFGPVLVIIRTSDVDEALGIENSSPYGNAASVFTESGGVAREVMERASAGMIGVNVGVPVPREPFSFGGWNESRFGVGDITGRGSLELWTQTKKLTTKWNTTGR